MGSDGRLAFEACGSNDGPSDTLNANEARRQSCKELQHFRAAHALPDHYRALRVYAVNLEDRFRNIETNCANLAHGRLPSLFASARRMGRVALLAIDTVLSQEDDGSYPGSQGARLMDIVVWLRSLGLEKYEAAFRENEIDDTVLPNLTAEDLKDLGITALGRRRKLLDAIATLRPDASDKTPSVDALGA
jgi:SAM domain (Sterile alpha motif)